MPPVSVSMGADGTLRVHLRGEIDFACSGQVGEAIRAAMAQEPPMAIRVDLSEVTFLDSSGIGVLVAAMRAAMELGADYRVEHPDPKVLYQLQMTGLAEMFGLAGPAPQR